MEKIEYYKNKDNIFYKYNLIKDDNKFGEAYQDLYFFEVYLRYNIDKEFKRVFGENWQENEMFKKLQYDQNLLQHFNITMEEMDKFLLAYNKPKSPSLGFWTKLFSSQFHDTLYNNNKILIANIFPGLKKEDKKPKKIHKDLEKIRIFRNKVFHFEAEKYLDNIEEEKDRIVYYTKALACDDFFINKGQYSKIYWKNFEENYQYYTVDYSFDASCDNIKNIPNVLNFEIISLLYDKESQHGTVSNFYFRYNNFNIIGMIYDYYDKIKMDNEIKEINYQLIDENQINIDNFINNIFDNCKSSLSSNSYYKECDLYEDGEIKIECDFNIIILSEYLFELLIRNKDKIDNIFDNKTKFITTLKDLPNLLNKIANDNAN